MTDLSMSNLIATTGSPGPSRADAPSRRTAAPEPTLFEDVFDQALGDRNPTGSAGRDDVQSCSQAAPRDRRGIGPADRRDPKTSVEAGTTDRTDRTDDDGADRAGDDRADAAHEEPSTTLLPTAVATQTVLSPDTGAVSTSGNDGQATAAAGDEPITIDGAASTDAPAPGPVTPAPTTSPPSGSAPAPASSASPPGPLVESTVGGPMPTDGVSAEPAGVGTESPEEGDTAAHVAVSTTSTDTESGRPSLATDDQPPATDPTMTEGNRAQPNETFTPTDVAVDASVPPAVDDAAAAEVPGRLVTAPPPDTESAGREAVTANSVARATNTTMARPVPGAPSVRAGSWTADDAPDLLGRAELNRLTGSTRLGIDLTTSELGSVRVEASRRDGLLHVDLTSDRSTTRSLLAEHADDLRLELRASGLDLDSVDVRAGNERRNGTPHDRQHPDARTGATRPGLPTGPTMPVAHVHSAGTGPSTTTTNTTGFDARI